MRTIHKYHIMFGEFNCIDVGESAKFLHFDFQDDRAYIWIELNDDEQRFWTDKYKIYGTGFDIPPNVEHVKSAINGLFVWHLYKVKND